MKKIGIIGWWQGKNEGDNYIKYCFQKYFQDTFDISFISTRFLNLRWYIRKLNKFDFIIVGGGGLFTRSPPPPFNTYTSWKRKLKTPFGFLGIGVQEINKIYEKEYEEILKDSVFFSVRDIESKNLLKKFSLEIAVAPDITFLYPRTIPLKNQTKIGVNLRVWDFDNKWYEVINKLPYSKKTIPLSFLKNIDDREVMKNIQGEKNQEFNISLYDDIYIMIGMRYHSIIFAVQNFIPSIGIEYTPKVRRLFSAMHLGKYCLSLEEHSELKDVFSELINNYDAVCRRYMAYTHTAKKEVENNLSKIKEMIKNEIL